jgi:hypothetical protein
LCGKGLGGEACLLTLAASDPVDTSGVPKQMLEGPSLRGRVLRQFRC